jgi:hypothetical protein
MWLKTLFSTAVSVFLIFVWMGAPAFGQDASGSSLASSHFKFCEDLEQGTRIRFLVGSEHCHGALNGHNYHDYLVGTLKSCDNGVLVIQPQDWGTKSLSVPLENIQSLDTSEGRKGYALLGMGIGLAAGVLLAVVTQSGDLESEAIWDAVPETEDRMVTSAFMIAGGGLLGLGIGASTNSEQWESLYGGGVSSSLTDSPVQGWRLAAGFSF